MKHALLTLALNLPAIALAAVAGMAEAYEMPWASITLAAIAVVVTINTSEE